MIPLWIAASLAAPTLDEVLLSADRHFPTILAATANLDAASGDRLSAGGAFDPRLQSGLEAGVYGKDTLVTRTSLTQATPAWGLDLIVGHQLGTGSFKPWDLGDETVDAGELTVDLALPLLSGGFTDSERTAIRVAIAREAEARARLELRRVEVARLAREAWFRWLGAGEKQRIAASAREVAAQVYRATQTRVAAGDLAAIEALDAERVLVERELRLVEAVRDTTVAAARLGLYLRDDAGQPAPPTNEAPPPLDGPEPASVELAAAISDALNTRPDLTAFARQIDAASSRLQLAKVSVLPKLDFKAGLIQPLSYGDKTEVKVGAALDVALAQRAARGRLDRARAELAGVDAEAALLRDRIAADVTAAVTVLTAAAEREALATRQVGLAKQLEDAARRGFEAGDRSLFDVYLREQATLAAATTRVDAWVDRRIAWAELLLVTGRRDDDATP